MNRRLLVLFLLMLMSIVVVGSVVVAQDATATPEPQPTEEMTEEATAETETEAEATETEGEAEDMSDDDMADVEGADTFVRFAHFAPGVDGVDVYLNDSVIDQTNLTYPAISDWIALDSGSYKLDVAPTGGSVDEAVISAADVAFGPGYMTIIVVPDENGQPGAFAVSVDREELLPGTSGLMLINGLSGNVPVNIDRDDVPFVTELGATSARAVYTPVDSAVYTFRAYDPYAADPVNYGEATEVELVDGNYYVVAVVGTPEDAQLIVHETTAAENAMITGELQAPGTLVEAVQSNDTLAGYADVFASAGLTETLSGEGPYTVFLPADFLLDEISAQVGDDTELLAATLRDHVIEGYIPLGSLSDMDSVTTLEGNTYDVMVEGNTITIGGLEIIDTNIAATNGVIHIINGILGADMPMDDGGEGETDTESDTDTEGEGEGEGDNNG